MTRSERYNSKAKALEEFGVIIYNQFDISIAELKDIIDTDKIESYKSLQSYIRTLDVREQHLVLARYALEGFIHDLMAMFQESEKFAICVMGEDGQWTDMKDAAERTLEFAQVGWQERYSKYESIGMKIV